MAESSDQFCRSAAFSFGCEVNSTVTTAKMRGSRRIHGLMAAAFAIGLSLVPALYLAQSQHQARSVQRESVAAFLKSYMEHEQREKDTTTQYLLAMVNLKDDGAPVVIVYVSGRTWCGSGGCTMLVLVPKDDSFNVVAKTTVTQLPVRVLTTRSNGWHDIGVWVQGGGIQPGYEAGLSFNGRTYPSNPTVPPVGGSKGILQVKS